jgi:hypothetical protein
MDDFASDLFEFFVKKALHCILSWLSAMGGAD